MTSSGYSNHPLKNAEGKRISNYLITGLDVSFGLDVFLSESFLVTLQLTPQFNYYIFSSDQTFEDPLDEYIQYGNFSDFKLGYLDIQLIYKF